MKPALAIFVKTPELSAVKTRLAETIGKDAATHFYRLSAAAVGAVAKTSGDCLCAYWAVAESKQLARARWPDLPVMEQGQGDLGMRLHQVYSTLLNHHPCVLMIGADAPQLTRLLLRQALDALVEHPFVIGPAADGGFWLFGGRLLLPRDVWTSVHYSQPSTASELSAALGPYGDAGRVPALADADTVEDLAAVSTALERLSQGLPEQKSLLAWLRKRDGAAHKSPLP